jgi:L-seryl-tRNA(Ser) seleniumtransferase
MTQLRDLPSVEQLLQTQPALQMIAAYGRSLTLESLRDTLGQVRTHFKSGELTSLPSIDLLLSQAEARLNQWIAPTLVPVINATGVILHTNLGRAPLSNAAIRAMDAVSRGYSTLEYDLDKGRRGSRLIHTEPLFQRLTGAEAALVVNNNASAVLLVLAALAARKRVIVARTQLVEIGGGFRVPDVMKQSGAKLVEVGTTNRVNLRDYEKALREPTALILHTHRSNFKIIGFTEEPDLEQLVGAGHASDVPVVDDLGSGALLDTAKYGLAHEPTVQESIRAGFDLVCFSGDKLLGGPQSGIIVGRAALVAKIRQHPLARAVRADKTCLAGLSATLLHYLKDEAEREIPIWQTMSLTQQQIKSRAEAWAREVEGGEVVKGESTIGGGSLPGELMPTFLLSLKVKSPDKFLKNLRTGHPPIIARTEKDRVIVDPRTVRPEQEGALMVGLKKALNE